MTPITRERLLRCGFEPFNEHFTYLSFPLPLAGTFRIDYRDSKKEPNVSQSDCWYIYDGYTDRVMKHPESMEQVVSFYHGICDKELDIKHWATPVDKIIQPFMRAPIVSGPAPCKVRITGCSYPQGWYAHAVGEEFEVDLASPPKDYVVWEDMATARDSWRHIAQKDCVRIYQK